MERNPSSRLTALPTCSLLLNDDCAFFFQQKTPCHHPLALVSESTFVLDIISNSNPLFAAKRGNFQSNAALGASNIP
jgi:hypothetical protein